MNLEFLNIYLGVFKILILNGWRLLRSAFYPPSSQSLKRYVKPNKPMNLRFLILSLMLLVFNVQAQDKFDTVNGSYFKIDGLSFTLKKQIILTKYGKPLREFEPEYECGFLSESEQGDKYYSLQYPHFKFTGNSKEGYLLEEIRFESGLRSKVTFKNKEISSKTTVKEFETIFGVKLDGHEKMLYFKGADDALIFTFVKGRLAKIEFWSPC